MYKLLTVASDDDVDQELREKFTRPGGGLMIQGVCGPVISIDQQRHRRYGPPDEERHLGP